MDKVYKVFAALSGAALSFITGFPPLVYILIGVMSIDYCTGLICAGMCKSPKTETGGISSRVAMQGICKKVYVLFLVLLSFLLDTAVAQSSGLVQFNAISGAVTLWFIASEGISVVENAAAMGIPVPGVMLKMLDMIKGAGGSKETDQREETE